MPEVIRSPGTRALNIAGSRPGVFVYQAYSSFPPKVRIGWKTVAPIIHDGDKHIRRDGDDYAVALAHLLPQGLAWPREANSVLMKTVRGLAQIFGYVDRRAADLLEVESDPRTTIELLQDWERNWGLPDFCFLGVGQSIDQRRKFLMLKMTLEGAQSRVFFIWVCKQLGYDVAITEFAPFMCGVSHVGDTRQRDESVNRFTGTLAA